jgi:hypothetical protein
MIPDTYVIVPKAVCPQWWPRPWSEMLAAADRGDDGLAIASQPKISVPDPKRTGQTKEVDDYPYTVKGAMVFRAAVAHWDGAWRGDTAMLHTQGW